MRCSDCRGGVVGLFAVHHDDFGDIIVNDPLHEIDVPMKDCRDPENTDEIEDDVEISCPASIGGRSERGETGRDGCADVFTEDKGSRSGIADDSLRSE